ncbi:MAG: hypothetical protein JNG88_00385 [Phycisphaerales bacterium]|nr:hypothetical protein [Phycisphaerales bacterium]
MLGHGSIWIDPAYRAALRAAGLDRADRVLGYLGGRVVAWSRTTDTVHISAGGRGPGFFVKRYRYPKWRQRVRGALRGTFFGAHRTQAEAATLTRLRAMGAPAVRPVAFGAVRAFHFVSACFLITEEVPGARNLTAYANDARRAPEALSPAQRREMIDQLAIDVAHLRAVDAEHGQLFWRNILFRIGAHQEPEYYFVDPDPQPLRRWLRGAAWWRMELARLAASARPFTTRSERLHFLMNVSAAEATDAEIKADAREIERLAERWASHESQRIHRAGLFSAWNRALAEELRGVEDSAGIADTLVDSATQNSRDGAHEASLAARVVTASAGP